MKNFNSGGKEFFAGWPKGRNCPQASVKLLPVGLTEIFAGRCKGKHVFVVCVFVEAGYWALNIGGVVFLSFMF
jgi:hypothetical protein